MSASSKAYFAFSTIGIAVAIYHSYEELTESFVSCNVSSKISCGGVFESGHTSLFGVPFYVLGLVWFPLATAIGFLSVQRPRGGGYALNGVILLPFLVTGSIFTIYLWYVELGVIGIICSVCVSLYAINYTLTALAAKSLFLSGYYA